MRKLNNLFKTSLGIAGFILLLYTIILAYVYNVSRPNGLGVTQGLLAACPTSPNCVSTQAINPDQKLAPIPYTTNAEEAKQRLLSIIKAHPRSTIETIEANPTYIAVVYRSAFFRFPDDVEFYIDEQNQLIHFRSASRIGKGDAGVNRARMVEFSNLFLSEK